ncbi:MAG: hypothetical protein ACRDR6_00510 [Pseudonocardiaceae bacterium]
MRGGLRGKIAVYLVATTLLVGTIASLSVPDAERYAPHATITTFGAGRDHWDVRDLVRGQPAPGRAGR